MPYFALLLHDDARIMCDLAKPFRKRDLQQDSVAASTAKHQNTQSESSDTTYTALDAKVTRYIKYDVKTLNTKDYT